MVRHAIGGFGDSLILIHARSRFATRQNNIRFAHGCSVIYLSLHLPVGPLRVGRRIIDVIRIPGHPNGRESQTPILNNLALGYGPTRLGRTQDSAHAPAEENCRFRLSAFGR